MEQEAMATIIEINHIEEITTTLIPTLVIELIVNYVANYII